MTAAVDPQFQEINSRWLEALDSSSGRTYYVNRETHETAWDAPEQFMERPQLAAAYCEVVAALQAAEAERDDEARFLAKVRARFPPSPGAPPGGSLKQAPPLKTAQSAPNPKAWKRGASVVLDEPPPPPAWALSKAKSLANYRCAQRPSLPRLLPSLPCLRRDCSRTRLPHSLLRACARVSHRASPPTCSHTHVPPPCCCTRPSTQATGRVRASPRRGALPRKNSLGEGSLGLTVSGGI